MLALLDFLLWFGWIAMTAFVAFDAGKRRERDRVVFPLLDRIEKLEAVNADLELREFARERQGNWWVN